MTQDYSLKTLSLTEAETLALLDMCLESRADDDIDKETALIKLTDLARRFMAEKQAERDHLPRARDIYEVAEEAPVHAAVSISETSPASAGWSLVLAGPMICRAGGL